MNNITPKRLWEKDATLWKNDPNVMRAISQRLGWLTIVKNMSQKVEEISCVARRIFHEGFKHVVLIGMGGSSLCADVLMNIFGQQKRWPDLVVLDSTDPDKVMQVEIMMKAKKTLFVVASKSGTTIETISHFYYLYIYIYIVS